MKAILLAAGLGTRLRPITNEIPKCLVPINNKPLLAYWLEKLVELGVEDILINTHYFSDKVEFFIESSPYKEKVTLVKENKLLGTGGTLITNSDFWKGDDTLIIHADNYCGDSLKAFIKTHKARPKSCDATVLLFETTHPEQCGIVELNGDNVVNAFHEKVANPPTNLASGALFIFSKEVYERYLKNFSKNHFYELSIDIVPLLINHLYSYKTTLPFIDIGTPSAYQYVQSQFDD
ncbi:nucleotidyltransferase family protein [Pseudoalteromonas sp. DL2-H2.2]|uniref:nucleotidyltransferase family protein n=1 Tax=Pseudoalteromonas sp. DL2-H2.2 TaxID=2908889 RepID=UPI001F282351|nr:nucleotidyltransferase family protein [Pseudoalteromonas sp. DL2-H2.2]MCF2909714.1 nucleotidyltransferase family protein [Pseudoalteromonas sp. DL2-H2.2]